MPTTDVEERAQELRLLWDRAADAQCRFSSELTDRNEQVSYDALVDFIEKNDLNYSKYDPRGPYDDRD